METLRANNGTAGSASITPAQTVPEELKRQSRRVQEQKTQLFKILDTSTAHLTEMYTMMEKYSPELIKQIKNLRDALDSYRQKSDKIYNEVSESLDVYATNLLNNLDNLTASVTKVANSVNNL